jgi:addiction module HigA family antidote
MATPSTLAAVEVDAETVSGWLDNHEAVLVDVRETTEYEQEHIPGSVLVPLSVFDPDLFPRIANKKIVFHCAVGKRSAAAAKQLLKAGHPELYNMTGGINAWKEAGLVTEIQFIPPALPDDVPVSGADREILETAMTGDHEVAGEWSRLHPGQVLLQEFLEPLGISQSRLAREIMVSPRRIGDLVRGNSAVTLDTGLRLARYFSTADDFWLRAQMDYELDRAQDALGRTIRREVKPRSARK